jgi:hypothetical protein
MNNCKYKDNGCDRENKCLKKNTSLKHEMFNIRKNNIPNNISNYSKTIKNTTSSKDNICKNDRFAYNKKIIIKGHNNHNKSICKDDYCDSIMSDKNIFTEGEYITTSDNNNTKFPITSIGIIGYYFNKTIKDYQFLLIRRKDTLGYVDFIRGKYQLHNKAYIMNLLNEMTVQERSYLKNGFNYNWNKLWGNMKLKQRYINEEYISKEKYEALVNGISTTSEFYNLESCLSNVETSWEEPEWGFPKGRREYREKELNTAIREFSEETGINNNNINVIYNIQPFEEIFNGSNFKSYKHKYYLAKINMPISCNKNNVLTNYQKSEVSAIDFKTYDESTSCIRDYDKEKKDILESVYNILQNFEIVH